MSDKSRLPVIPFTQVHPDQILSDQLLASLLGTSVDTLQRCARKETPRHASASASADTARVCATFRRGSTVGCEGQETR